MLSSRHSDSVVYVGNLDKSVTSNELLVLFSGAGIIRKIKLYSKSGYAFIEFENENQARVAIEQFNRHNFFNRVLRVEKVLSSDEYKKRKRRLISDNEDKKKRIYKFFDEK